jgi:hypothetical protein
VAVGHRCGLYERKGFTHLPLVPAPTYTTRPPRRTRGARASIAPAISGRQTLTLSATLWSSELMTVHISSVDMRSMFIVRGFTPSVCNWAKLLRSIVSALAECRDASINFQAVSRELGAQILPQIASVAQMLTICVATVDRDSTQARVQAHCYRPPLAELVSSSFLGHLGVSDHCRAEPSSSGLYANEALPSALAVRHAGGGLIARVATRTKRGGIPAAT